jgi:hypothetical protein
MIDYDDNDDHDDNNNINNSNTKLRTNHEGPEGEYRYSSTPSSTSALYGFGW